MLFYHQFGFALGIILKGTNFNRQNGSGQERKKKHRCSFSHRYLNSRVNNVCLSIILFFIEVTFSKGLNHLLKKRAEHVRK